MKKRILLPIALAFCFFANICIAQNNESQKKSINFQLGFLPNTASTNGGANHTISIDLNNKWAAEYSLNGIGRYGAEIEILVPRNKSFRAYLHDAGASYQIKKMKFFKSYIDLKNWNWN
jgi:hypothetical protein